MDEEGSLMIEAAIYYPIIIVAVLSVILISLVKLQQVMIDSAMEDAYKWAYATSSYYSSESEYRRQLSKYVSEKTILNYIQEVNVTDNYNSLFPNIEQSVSISLKLPRFVAKCMGTNNGGSGTNIIAYKKCYYANPTETAKIASLTSCFVNRYGADSSVYSYKYGSPLWYYINLNQ